MIKNILLVFALLLSTAAYADGAFVMASPIDNPNGKECKVFVPDYHAGSGVMYLGNCGWFGLNGIAAYVQGWNYANHIKIVRGSFEYGQVKSYSKVTYINKVNKTIQTYEQSYRMPEVRQYNLDEILTDAVQAGLPIDNSIMSYVKFANYIDTLE
jgi:hypothetical protein